MPSARFDLLIRNATVYDGTGRPPRTLDVALGGDRIVAIGDLGAAETTRTLDARGLALAPGFIDVHSHDDFAVLLHPEMRFKVLQGVTTDIVGNCGLGVAPRAAAVAMAESFHPGAALPQWDGYAGYMGLLAEQPPSLNVGVLVGHGTLRLDVMGTAARAPTSGEIAHMRKVVHEGIAAGALGLSTGLIYEPACHAVPDEIEALAAELSGTGAVYATHMRDEADHLLESIRESLHVGETARVAVQISHHKAAGRENWGRVRDSLRLIEEARARGLDVTADQYPYTSASTIMHAVVRSGGLAGGSGGLGRMAPDDIVVATAPRHPEWQGKTLAELATVLALTPEAAAERVLEEEGAGATAILHLMSEDDVRTVMAHPTTMIGSDGLPTLAGKPHPRLYGTFPRVLGRYARDERLLQLHEAIFRMTGFPAAKFGLADRGVIRAGAYADLVLFDAARIIDRATEDDPHQYPVGIVQVFVNGATVARDGEHTGARPGRVLGRG